MNQNREPLACCTSNLILRSRQGIRMGSLVHAAREPPDSSFRPDQDQSSTLIGIVVVSIVSGCVWTRFHTTAVEAYNY